LCRQSLPKQRGIQVDLATNSLLVDGQVIKLWPKEAELMSVLVGAMPRVLSKELLTDRLYGVTNSLAPDSKVIEMWISNLRKKLRGSPLRIETIRGRGFRLVHGTRKPNEITELQRPAEGGPASSPARDASLKLAPTASASSPREQSASLSEAAPRWPDCDDELREYWRAGMPASEIATIFGASKNAVLGRARRLGLSQRKAKGRPWTPADDETLRRMWADGKGSREIGKALDRLYVVVNKRAARLGLAPRANPIKPVAVITLNTPERRPGTARKAPSTFEGPRRRPGVGTQSAASSSPSPAPNVVALHIHREQAKHLQRERAPRSLRPVFAGPAPRRCQFPMWGHDERPTQEFCGKQSVEGRPYCESHSALCYSRRPVGGEEVA